MGIRSRIIDLQQRLARKLGLVIYRFPRHSDLRYEKVTPYATYSPWNEDELFKETYSVIQKATLVDKYRCFELWSLVEQSAKLENGCIIEIGVWRGGTGVLIATKALNCGIAEPVYLCDTFTGVAKAGASDSYYRGGEHADTSRKIVEDAVNRQALDSNVRILEGIFPDQTSHEIEQEVFRFCHIDVDVYQSAKDIMEWIWGRMVPGGIVVYDDFGFGGCDGITKHVEEQKGCQDKLIIHNLNGHAVVIKI